MSQLKKPFKDIANKVGVGGVAAMAVGAVLVAGVTAVGAANGADDAPSTSPVTVSIPGDDDGTPDQGSGDAPGTPGATSTTVTSTTVATVPTPPPAATRTIPVPPRSPPRSGKRGEVTSVTAKPAGSDGVGLGLSVARGLTEAMGGRLTPETTPGGGLTMVVTLPVADAGGDDGDHDGANEAGDGDDG